MRLLLKGAKVLRKSGMEEVSVLVEEGRIVSLSKEAPQVTDAKVIELNHGCLLPGFVDVHVHLREPGFSYKETIATGTLAAARGGYTSVCPMPNLKPVPDSLEHLQPELDAIARTARVHVHPYGAITVGEKGETLAALEELAPHVVAFSDDGKGVQRDERMKEAMHRAKALGKLIVAHCEDESLLNGGYIHDGAYAAAHGHRGNPSASEWKQVERDLALVRETGCAYHVCHVSTKETVELIRAAKAEGLDVTCETAPHYLVFNDTMLQEDGRFKMNPPIRSEEDRQALIAGLLDGTVDMIATDHAPHAHQEKAKGLEKSLFGIVGLETAFPVLYTKLVKPGIMTLDKLVELLSTNPAKRFGIGAPLEEGAAADFTVFDLEARYTIDPAEFRSKGKSSPFTGQTVYGRCLLTVSGGEIVWQESQRMQRVLFTIQENRCIAKDTYRMTLTGDTGAITGAGQFVNIALEGKFLRRPISVCDWTPESLTLIYKAVGQGTAQMSRMEPGAVLDILTGLGNGYDLEKSGETPLLIGGGAGVPPLYALAKKLLAQGKKPSVILGFNREEELFLRDEFEALGIPVTVATADGSVGVKGFVTDAMPASGYSYLYTCGPEPMLRAVYEAMTASGQFSFEERMGCGFGACMGCTCQTKYGNKRICREGPVLEKEEIIW